MRCVTCLTRLGYPQVLAEAQPIFPSAVASHAELDHNHLWHPFTQQRDWESEDPVMIASGEGAWLTDEQGNRYLDGVSSLWCNVHGHRHPAIDRALHEQVDRISHSTMLGLSHGGAAELAARLVEITPAGLDRVFYSDSGSTAVEVALKMAFQYWQLKGGQHVRRASFICLEGAYHGDTVGSVSVGGIDLFHSTYGPLLFESHQANPDDPEDIERLLATHEEEVAAVVIEPLVQGAAGIRLHPEGYLGRVRELCDRHGALLICDEVATGFGRTGSMFACEREGVSPDLLCLAKGLTGGYLPLAATLTSDEIYETFLAPHEDFKTFFHGHTYTGNPLACAAAIATLETFEQENTLENLQPKIALFEELLAEISEMSEVEEVRQCGFMAGIDLGEHPAAERIGHQVVLEARQRGAILRPLGDTVVLMPPLAIDQAELERLMTITRSSIRAACRGALSRAGQRDAALLDSPFSEAA